MTIPESCLYMFLQILGAKKFFNIWSGAHNEGK